MLGLFLFCFFGALWTGAGQTAWGNVISLDRNTDHLLLGSRVEMLEDRTGTLSLSDVLADDRNPGWFMAETDTINFGFSDSVLWLKATLRNVEAERLSRLVEIAYPILDSIQVFVVRPDGQVESCLMGDSFSFSARLIRYRSYLVPLDLAPLETVDLVFRIRSTSSMQIPLDLFSIRAFIETRQLRTLGYGIYYGIMLAMILYNLFVFISVREASYLYYVCYVVSMALFLSCLNGFSFQYLWPDCLIWNDKAVAVSISSLVLFGLLFTRIFLDLPGNKPRMNQWSIYLVIFLGVQLLLCCVLPYRSVIHLVILNALVMIFFSLFAGILRWIDGYSAARYYTVSWLVMLVGGLIMALNKLGIVPRNFLTENTLQFGSAIEVILLSFALADRLSMEKSNRYKAQKAALASEKRARMAQAKALEMETLTRQAREEALLIQKQANENLENNVRLRTRELEIANARLRELSTTDSLTGLKNRRYFNEIYYKEYTRSIRDKSPLSCLIMDIDHFKRINDTFGHLIGDECLKAVARAIRKQLHRDNDFLARYGGEEFCVLLTGTGAAGAMQVAEKIRLCVERLQFTVGGQAVPLAISLGVASETPDHKKNAESLLNKADSALYQAKAMGRNRVALFGPDPDQGASVGNEQGV
ncbi:diguanylate cyclase [Desulfatiferula olefinivorans]